MPAAPKGPLFRAQSRKSVASDGQLACRVEDFSLSAVSEAAQEAPHGRFVLQILSSGQATRLPHPAAIAGEARREWGAHTSGVSRSGVGAHPEKHVVVAFQSWPAREVKRLAGRQTLCRFHQKCSGRPVKVFFRTVAVILRAEVHLWPSQTTPYPQ